MVTHFNYIFYSKMQQCDKKQLDCLLLISLELKAVENSSLYWTRNCSRKRNQRNGDSKKSSLVDDILGRSKQENERSSSSKSRNKYMCPCQKLKESMEFGLSWYVKYRITFLYMYVHFVFEVLNFYFFVFYVVKDTVIDS